MRVRWPTYELVCSTSRRTFALLFVITLFAGFSCPVASAQTPPSKSIHFTDVAEKAGIRFARFKGNNGISINLEEFGPGVCVSDSDGDGWQDIYFVSGRDHYDRGINVQNALYHNNRDGTFSDVTDKAGVPGTGYGLGCVWGDYDNDGFPDLFVTQYGKNVLYHNNGEGTFTDVTDQAGVAGMEFGTWFHSGATFFEYDRTADSTALQSPCTALVCTVTGAHFFQISRAGAYKIAHHSTTTGPRPIRNANNPATLAIASPNPAAAALRN
jgi:VCBS repeat protein